MSAARVGEQSDVVWNLRVAQSVCRDAVERRRRDDAPEGAGRAEADVVGHDEEDVRRALRRHHARRPGRFRLQGVQFDVALERRVGGGS